MNLVFALLVLGIGPAAVWAGITDPEGGMFAGLARGVRGEPQQRSTARPSAFLTSLAGFTGGGAGSGTAAPAAFKDTGAYDLGAVKSHVRAAAYEVGPMFGITNVLGWGTRPNATDHDDGLALDFMTPNGSALAAYVLLNRKRLGVKYVIWNQRINHGDGWSAMEDRGTDTANHKDHVHVSFNTKATKAPSKGIAA